MSEAVAGVVALQQIKRNDLLSHNVFWLEFVLGGIVGI
jgi:hypothetical protein